MEALQVDEAVDDVIIEILGFKGIEIRNNDEHLGMLRKTGEKNNILA